MKCKSQVPNLLPDIVQFLDARKKTIRKSDPASFAEAVHPFLSPEPMSSTLGSDKRALWPLVCKVDIQYKSPILARGLSLVDLPGGGDSNKARTRVAEEYLNRCDHLMIVSTSVRPGSEATAHGSSLASVSISTHNDTRYDE